MKNKAPRAVILTVGDEILIGQIVDSNSAHIGEQLTMAGVQVIGIESLSDDLQEIEEGLKRAIGRAEIVIMTGGLGPTKDDITKQALCQVFGAGMRRDASVTAHLRGFLAARGVEFNELNQAQADVVEGFEVLQNDCGTAPGMVRLIVDSGPKKLLFCLPGVPFEMRWLMQNRVLPRIVAEFSLIAPKEYMTGLVYGLPESELAQRIAGWESGCRAQGLSLAYLPNARGIRLRLGGAGRDILERQFIDLQRVIPECWLGEEPTSIEMEVARLLLENGQMLAIAESCTGGAISARCTAIAGSSGWYSGGVVSYSNSAKSELLGVPTGLIERCGAVSQEVVEAMATGVADRLRTTCAIATSGIAGPTGDDNGKQLGDVWIAIKVGTKVQSWHRNMGQPREVFIQRTASAALNYLRLALRNQK